MKIKEIPQSTDTRYYDLFEEETVKDVNDNDVTIPKRIGNFSLEGLKKQRIEAVKRLSEIDKKIEVVEEFGKSNEKLIKESK